MAQTVDLTPRGSVLELLERRRVLEPEVTALGAARTDPKQAAVTHAHLPLKGAVADDAGLFALGAAPDEAVARARGDAALEAPLRGVSGVASRARTWHASFGTSASAGGA